MLFETGENMDLRQEVERAIRETTSERGKQLSGDLLDDLVLLESGLDSLDFAIVVARLEVKLDADPFAAMQRPVYPHTLGDLIQIYEAHFANSK